MKLFLVLLICFVNCKSRYEDDPEELWSWLNRQIQIKESLDTKCEGQIEPSGFGEPFIKYHDTCPKSGIFYQYEGPKDSQGKPHGNGKLVKDSKHRGGCYELFPHIEYIYGHFLQGYLDGKVMVKYSDDDSYIEANIVKNVLHGQIRILDGTDQLIWVGRYENGLPTGPFWFYAPFAQQFVLVNFEQGLMIEEPIALVDMNDKSIKVGKMLNETWLESTRELKSVQVVEHNGIKTIKMDDTHDTDEVKENINEIPLKITHVPEEQRITSHPAKMLYFNKVAKSGSTSFTGLLVHQGQMKGYKVIHKRRTIDIITQPDNLQAVQQEVKSVLKERKPRAITKHYSFINFASFGSKWSPDYISILRDPLERIISMFYFDRAAWNIVGKIQQFGSNYKPPSMEYLNKDFESCVLDPLDKECNFIQDNIILEQMNNQASQLQYFCGHKPVCRKFNNAEALKLAKANVEKYYKSVGILEWMNMTLPVFEHIWPQYFSNANQTYFHHPYVKSYKITNVIKLPVSEEIRNLVKANLTTEYEFYEFCKQRLKTQFDDIF